MKTKTKNTIIILSIVMIAILVVISYFKILLNKNIDYIIENKKNNFLISEKINSSFGLKSKSEEITKISNSLNDFYIDRNNIVNFIKIIEQVAIDNEVTLIINKVDVDESHLEEDLPYGVLTMVLTVNGKLNSNLAFLAKLEKLPYHLDFGAINLKANEENQDWSLNIAITGITN
jgi:hypothetical protein